MMSQLSIVKLFLRKSSVFKRFVHDTLVSSSGTSVESYMLYYRAKMESNKAILTSFIFSFTINVSYNEWNHMLSVDLSETKSCNLAGRVFGLFVIMRIFLKKSASSVFYH